MTRYGAPNAVYGAFLVWIAPALAAPPQSSERLGAAGSIEEKPARLTVVVGATLPRLTKQQATAKLQRILRGSPYVMTAAVRRSDQQDPDQSGSQRFPESGPLELTFKKQLNERYCVSVAVTGLLPPRVASVALRTPSERVEITIPFAELRVESEPGFGLFVSRSRDPFAHGAPNPDTFIARTGRLGDPTDSDYAVGADGGGVAFLYWPVPAVWAVLSAAETREDRTEALNFRVTGGEKVVTRAKAKAFSRIVFRSIEVPQQSRCSCAQEVCQ